jgi:hypothetical protein
VDPELDLRRLAELQELLGADLREIVTTLVTELNNEFGAIDAGLAGDDLGAVAMAAHAARNSALMIDAHPVLAGLRELESGALAGDMLAALAANERLHDAWPRLRTRLELALAGRR